MRDFHYLFAAGPATATAVGWIIESRIHQLLKRQQIIQVLPIRDHHQDSNAIYNDYATSKAGNNLTNYAAATPEGAWPEIEGPGEEEGEGIDQW